MVPAGRWLGNANLVEYTKMFLYTPRRVMEEEWYNSTYS